LIFFPKNSSRLSVFNPPITMFVSRWKW